MRSFILALLLGLPAFAAHSASACSTAETYRELWRAPKAGWGPLRDDLLLLVDKNCGSLDCTKQPDGWIAHPTLTVLERVGSDWRVAERYVATLGSSDGRKRVEDDKRTPEGLYTNWARYARPDVNLDSYGGWSLVLSYPNPDDLARMGTQTMGCGIAIHGGKKRSTAGCVRVLDSEVVATDAVHSKAAAALAERWSETPDQLGILILPSLDRSCQVGEGATLPRDCGEILSGAVAKAAHALASGGEAILHGAWPSTEQLSLVLGPGRSGVQFADNQVGVRSPFQPAEVGSRAEPTPVPTSYPPRIQPSASASSSALACQVGPGSAKSPCAAALVLDDNLQTAWCEGVAGYGEGEVLTLDLGREVVVSGIALRAGYQKSSSLFWKNGRPAALQVTAGALTRKWTLNSGSEALQTFQFPAPVSARRVELKIVSVDRAGARYPDTCISEVTITQRESR